MNINLLKLRKQLLQLASVSTDKGDLIAEGEIAEGVEVFVEDENGEFVPAPDGEYEAEDRVIVVAEGKVSEIREKESDEAEESEPESEPASEEMSAVKGSDKFNAVKAQFEASYQEIERNIYSALDDAGVYGYLIENGNDYAIVSEWDMADDREHLFRYEISIDENGYVTLGEKKEVRVEYVDVDASESEDEPSNEDFQAVIAEKDAKIAELEKQLKMSADEPAKEKVKKEVKSGALKYFM